MVVTDIYGKHTADIGIVSANHNTGVAGIQSANTEQVSREVSRHSVGIRIAGDKKSIIRGIEYRNVVYVIYIQAQVVLAKADLACDVIIHRHEKIIALDTVATNSDGRRATVEASEVDRVSGEIGTDRIWIGIAGDKYGAVVGIENIYSRGLVYVQVEIVLAKADLTGGTCATSRNSYENSAARIIKCTKSHLSTSAAQSMHGDLVP